MGCLLESAENMISVCSVLIVQIIRATSYYSSYYRGTWRENLPVTVAPGYVPERLFVFMKDAPQSLHL